MFRFISLTASLATSVVALSLLGACSMPPASPKLPVVLVHGAWSEASAWDRVAADLRARGHTVTAVNLPGHGHDSTPLKELSLAGYADAVAKALPANGQALLVGHSLAGMVISQVAENAPERVAKLVYVAGYLPRNGESLYQLALQDKGSQVGKFWRQDDPKAYSPATIAKEGLIATFCADCSPADQQYLHNSHKAEAVPPLGTPVKLSAERFGRVPRAYVHTSEDQTVSLGLQQQMLAAAGGASPVVTLKTSHMPMLTQPRALVEAIAAAAP
jgi:pimeloyl-ACP methyl ester carboxylesterase